MYALWRHPSCRHTLLIIGFCPYSGQGSSSSQAEFVVAERPSKLQTGSFPVSRRRVEPPTDDRWEHAAGGESCTPFGGIPPAYILCSS